MRVNNSAIPPLKNYRINNAQATLAIELFRSEASGLPQGLTIILQIEISDVATRAIKISACGCVDCDISAAQIEPHLKHCVTTTFDPSLVQEALERVVYDFMEQAQIDAEDTLASLSNRWFSLR